MTARPAPPPGGALAGYPRHIGPGRTDELVDGDGAVRAHWAGLAAAYERLGTDELRRRTDEIRLLLQQDGVTYNLPDGGTRHHRPWDLDALPLVVPGDEWRTVERGLVQRAELLDLVLRDLYGERRLLRSGLVPPAVVLADPELLRPCDGIVVPGPKQLVLAAVDLARSGDRGWVALGHRTQAPSGAAYAAENRRVVARVFPQLLHDTGVQRVAPYMRALRNALRAAAPPGVDDPTIVILSPGPWSETAFEHASVAAQLGYPLVEGNDLDVRGGRLWLRAVGRLTPVHVVLRRLDAGFSDPLELRTDSTLGVPGLVDACRTQAVSVVNVLGSGVLENAGLLSLLPQLARHLLGEELVLPSAEAWWCGEPAGRARTLEQLGSIVVRPLSRSVAAQGVDTRGCSRAELDDLRRRIEHRPGLWVGQEAIELSTAPMLGDAGVEARPTVLRAFAVAAGDGYLAMAGGLARVAGDDPSAPITSRAGAVAKDVWVVGADPEPDIDFWLAPPEAASTHDGVAGGPPPARAAEHLFWLGRYAERAEAAVRLLRAVNSLRDEFQHAAAGPGPAALAVLLETTTRVTATFPGFVGDDSNQLLLDPDTELLSVVVDERRPGTVAHSVARMFEAIDVVRDQLSVDTWIMVGRLQDELDRLDRTTEGRDEATTKVLNHLLQGLLALGGLANESMVRDHGWYFLEAGRRLERGLQVVGLVGAALASERGAAAESQVLESVLSAGESIITYRRRYRSRARVATVLELLVADPGNPRSLRFQLDALTTSLAVLEGPGAASSFDAAGLPASASAHTATVAAHVRALDPEELAGTDPKGRRVALEAFAGLVRTGLSAVSERLEAESFTRLLPVHSVVTPVELPALPR